MKRLRLILLPGHLLIGFLTGCTPKIGDECKLSTECSSTNDRICDPTQPGGYCTIFNCEPGTCPEEAVCVAFGATDSRAAGCDAGDGRLRRTFCMASCNTQSDCRAGYSCVELADQSRRIAATVVEIGAFSSKVCMVPVSSMVSELPSSPAVCRGNMNPFPEPPRPASSAGGAGAGAVGAGQGGAAAGASAAGGQASG